MMIVKQQNTTQQLPGNTVDPKKINDFIENYRRFRTAVARQGAMTPLTQLMNATITLVSQVGRRGGCRNFVKGVECETAFFVQQKCFVAFLR